MKARARRIDRNQPELVQWFRDHGCSVAITSSLGDGFPDLVIGYRGMNILVEIKDGSKPPSRRALTDDERKFMMGWHGWYVVIDDEAGASRLLDGADERLNSQYRI